MKKIIYISFILIINYSLLIDNCFPQWVQQNSGTIFSLADIQFINQYTGWVCGANGTILKTTNAGLNWVVQITGVTETLYDIHAVDSEYVYCVGIFETILKTTNGGSNWIVIRSGVNPGKFFYGLSFINRTTGWICGSGQWTLRTTNGFATIDSSMIGVSYAWDIYFKDNLNGLVGGESGTFYKSTNGGINWNLIIVSNETSDFFEMSFIGDVGWLIGLQNRKVHRTINFGQTWDSISRVTPEPDNWNAVSIFFSSINTGWTCGGAAKVFKTTNGGYNWLQQVIPVFTAYSSVFFINDSIGWCAGNTGTILQTSSGGLIVPIQLTGHNLPIIYKIYHNYPNPFNPSTIIRFEIPQNSYVKLTVYNSLGEQISDLVNQRLNAGIYEVEFNAANLSSGIYFYTFFTEEYKETKKMILIK
ncbi:MAG: T9SS type A sorting domain-containing protein [Ignavibacteria bacterium]|nr:T9SS type A sorting domain-containing protein [Ignavibacteria bacterium]